MDESWAWLQQGIADHDAAIALGSFQRENFRCHVIAKFQQSVEKCVKSIVAALREANILSIEIGWTHAVSPFVKVMIRLPHARANFGIQRSLWILLDIKTRETISALDKLVPRRPPPGREPERNTEYPFRNDGEWTFPAKSEAFDAKDIQRFQGVVNRIRTQAPRIVSALSRQPRK